MIAKKSRTFAASSSSSWSSSSASCSRLLSSSARDAAWCASGNELVAQALDIAKLDLLAATQFLIPLVNEQQLKEFVVHQTNRLMLRYAYPAKQTRAMCLFLSRYAPRFVSSSSFPVDLTCLVSSFLSFIDQRHFAECCKFLHSIRFPVFEIVMNSTPSPDLPHHPLPASLFIHRPRSLILASDTLDQCTPAAFIFFLFLFLFCYCCLMLNFRYGGANCRDCEWIAVINSFGICM